MVEDLSLSRIKSISFAAVVSDPNSTVFAPGDFLQICLVRKESVMKIWPVVVGVVLLGIIGFALRRAKKETQSKHISFRK